MSPKPRAIVLLDATDRIGSGHAMRCMAVAQALGELGCEVFFAVQCKESAEFVASLGYRAEVLGGDPMRLGERDGRTLASLCAHEGAAIALVDTYAVTDGFFSGLADAKPGSLCIAYLDDSYTFGLGNLVVPKAWPVDVVLNYSLYADERAYREAYEDGKASLLLGPTYVPLRREFLTAPAHGVRHEISDVLVTTGATNPDGTLERLARLAREAFEGAAIHVVVGASARFDGATDGLDILGPQPSLLPLMERCDACISAAGTTIYELSALGVPALSLAIAANQEQNAHAFSKLGLGLSCGANATDGEIFGSMCKLRDDAALRAKCAERMREKVPGDGALRIAAALLGD